MQLIPYNGQMGNGVSLRLRAVQVIKFKEYVAASPFDVEEGFTQGGASTNADDLDSVFDVEAVEEEEVAEPKVKVSKKKKEAPKEDVDLASLLDGFDD